MQLCAVNPVARGARIPDPEPGWVAHEGLWVPAPGAGETEREAWREWCRSWAACEQLGSSAVLRAALERSPRFGSTALTLLGVGSAELGQWVRIGQSELVTVAAVLVAAEDEMDDLGVLPDPRVFAPIRRVLARGARCGVCWVGACVGAQR